MVSTLSKTCKRYQKPGVRCKICYTLSISNFSPRLIRLGRNIMKFTFGIREHIKKSWALYKEHFGLMLLLGLINGILQIISQKDDNFFLVFIVMVAGTLLAYVWMRSLLSLVDGKGFKPFTAEILPTFPKFWDFIKVNILGGLFILLGFILLIIPGFYITGRLSFAWYLSVEKHQGARKSIRESWEMTRGYGWMLFWKSLLIVIFGVLGIIGFGVGILITMPIAYVMQAMLYKKFKTFSQGDVVPVEPVPETPTEATTTPHAEETTVEKVIE